MEPTDVYQAAMREAASAAWDRDWPRAIAAYRQALQAVPDETQALAGLGLSLMEGGHYPEALKTYQRVSELVSSDPLPREKMAEIFQRTNNYSEAAKQYLAAAEIYYARKDIQRAIPNWASAIRFNSELAQAHMRLAVAYEQDEQTRLNAVYSYLHVARLLQKMGQGPRAEQAIQRALTLDPINPDVRDAHDDLRQGKPIHVPDPATQVAVQSRQAPAPKELPSQEDQMLEAIEAAGEKRTPIEEAARHAMGVLADIIWTGEVPSSAQTPLLKAIDAHQVDDAEAAAQYYSQAFNAGLDHPALRFNLGVLYHSSRQYDQTAGMLEQTVNDEAYSLASHLMLGQARYAQDQLDRAAEHMLEALHSADRHVNELQVDEGGYDRLTATLPTQPREYLVELSRALALFLDQPGWEDRLKGALTNYAAQGRVSYVSDLIELMIEGGRPEISAIMQRIDEYLDRSLLHLASEEAHYAIERSPDYLPAHRRLADILIREARTHEAVLKLNLIANTYYVRGNADKAADLFAEVIQLWPADTGARQRVIDMLRSQGRVAEAISHYIEMADLHYRLMADPDRAIEIYNEALDYARKEAADPQLSVPVLKALADIETQRLNWRRALIYYERAVEISPADEDVALGIVELHFQLGDPAQAIRALDNYMRQCISRGDVRRVTSTLEEQARRRPDEIPLRQRLAEVYRQQGRLQEAIAQMDALGELQLDAGRLDDAIATIRRIISLNPPDVEGYRHLLADLESGNR
jgi:tetratricopeptide (TPR) repeat protein